MKKKEVYEGDIVVYIVAIFMLFVLIGFTLIFE